MNEKSRMSSIARKINMEFWMRQLSIFLVIDLVLVILITVSFFLYWEGLIPDSRDVIDRTFTGDTFEKFAYLIKTDGKDYLFSIKEAWKLVRVPTWILLALEGIFLIGGLFHTGKIRTMMRPLYDMALKTERLSKMPFDSEKFENIEAAITNLDPKAPDAHVITGDADLRSLEIAINNLIDRMRETYKLQQRFVSDASHELRTPISVIQGYVNMLDRWGKKDEKVLSESIEAIKNESDHMKNLIEQLLFLARGDSGRNTLQFAQFDLTEMVKDVIEESEMIDEHHAYVFEGDSQPITVRADLAMLKQCLRIFVQNAAKYTLPGDQITLRTQDMEEKAAFIVQDEGIGMASSDVAHIFERFYRAEGARERSEGGTGLGLSIAKWIVDAHNGQIQVLSRPEFGTRFTVIFPKEIQGLS